MLIVFFICICRARVHDHIDNYDDLYFVFCILYFVKRERERCCGHRLMMRLREKDKVCVVLCPYMCVCLYIHIYARFINVHISATETENRN